MDPRSTKHAAHRSRPGGVRLVTASRGPSSKSSRTPYIFGLPDELFEAIFNRFRPTMSSDWEDVLITRTWWSIPAVCSRWRRVALHYPSYWTHILLHKAELTRTMLERSKAAPLVVSCNAVMHGPEVEENLLLIVPQAHRFAELEVVCLMRTVEVLASELASFPAPLLTKLSISCMGSENEKLPIIPVGIFDGCTPRLSHLSLNGCRTPWAAPIFQDSLTFVHLDDIQPLNTQGMNAMMDALMNMVNLEYFALYMVQPRRRSLVRILNGSVGERTIVLPRLSTLHAVGIITDVAHLLNLLILPSDAYIRLNMCHVAELEPWIITQEALCQTFSGHLASQRCDAVCNSHDGPIRTIQLACHRSVQAHDGLTFEIRTSRSGDATRDSAIRNRVFWKDIIDLDDCNMDILTILPTDMGHPRIVLSLTSQMLESLYPSAVEYLIIQPAARNFTEEWWQTLSACMPNVHTITVQGNATTLSLFKCLAISTQTSHSVGEPFTSLTELALECVDFGDSTIFDTLIQAAEHRHLQRLSLRWSNITRPALSHLQKLFKQITWDYKEEGRDEALGLKRL